jgi:hypothetical protein
MYAGFLNSPQVLLAAKSVLTCKSSPDLQLVITTVFSVPLSLLYETTYRVVTVSLGKPTSVTFGLENEEAG